MRRIVPVLFCAVAMVMAAGDWIGNLPEELPVGTEITELRDAHSKHYYMGDGLVRAVISSAPVHALNERGQWVETDGRDTLHPPDDAYVYERNPNNNYNNGTSNRCGRWLSSSVYYIYRSFMKFDLSSISSGTTLDACTLNMYMYTWNGGSGEQEDIDIYRATEDWVETSVTWNNQPNVDPTLQSTQVVDHNYDWYDWEITDLVQDWVDGTYTNYGLRFNLRDEATQSNRQAYFNSAEYSTYPERRPYLVLWYQLPGEVLITNVAAAPEHPFGGEDISVAAKIWAVDENIGTAQVQYANSEAGPWTNVDEDSSHATDSTYFFTIPGQTGGDSLAWRLYAQSTTDGELTTAITSLLVPPYYSIYDLQYNSEPSPHNGEYVHTTGIVTGVLNERQFYIADAAGAWNGMTVYLGYGSPLLPPDLGDSVDVIGVMDEYRGLDEVADIDRIAVGGTMRSFDTTKLGFPDARLEDFEAVCVRFDSVRIVDASGTFSGGNYDCTTIDYLDTIELYCDYSSDFVGTPIPTGAFNLVCNMGQYYSTRQLMPRYPGDVTELADIEAVAILAPGATMEPGETVAPTAVFRNNDGSVTAANVPITFAIGGFYLQDDFITELTPGETDTVTFPSWTAVTGTHEVMAVVHFAGDPDPTNDTVRMTLTVSPPGPPTGAWTEVEPMPSQPSGRAVKRGGWSASLGDVIYAGKGYKTQDFYKYDPVADTWTTLGPLPYGDKSGRQREAKKGSRGIGDGGNHLYYTAGNNTNTFYKYWADRDSWAALSDVPEGPNRKRVKGGNDMAYVVLDDTGFVYLMKGYKTEFYRFNVETETWEILADVPASRGKVKRGSWLAYDGADALYAHEANYYNRTPPEAHYMYKYDIPSNAWTTVAGTPLYGLHGGRVRKKKSKDGGSADYYNGGLYALKGGNTQQFWHYDLAGDTWTELDTVPTNGSTGRKRRVKYGAKLVHWKDGQFFTLKGNKTLETWRFVVGSGLFGCQPTRSGVAGGRIQQPLGVTVSPNPLAGGFATLRYALPKASAATLSVFDVTGRQVTSRSLVATRTGAVSLDLRSLSNGVYLVRLDADDYTTSRKLVVQH